MVDSTSAPLWDASPLWALLNGRFACRDDLPVDPCFPASQGRHRWALCRRALVSTEGK